MSDKIIKVTGCHDCGKKDYYKKGDEFLCTADVVEGRCGFVVTQEVLNKTIHPACQLDDYEEQKWISVEDRLPDDNIIAIVLGVEDPFSIAYRSAINPWPSKWYDNCDGACVTGITHWMPLPQKPDAQKGEG